MLVAAYFIVAAYLGIVALGSEAMPPPPKPLSAVAPAQPQRAALATSPATEELVAGGAQR